MSKKLVVCTARVCCLLCLFVVSNLVINLTNYLKLTENVVDKSSTFSCRSKHVFQPSRCQCNNLTRHFSKIKSKCNETEACFTTNKSIISYSLFGNTNEIESLYYSLLRENAITVGRHLPGWKIRIYHDFPNHTSQYSELCHLSCDFQWVELFDIRQIRRQIIRRETNRQHTVFSRDELQGLNKRLWRFLSFLDDEIDIVAIRDTDAKINERELAALRQWLSSNYTFHVMRDHQEHRFTILAGLFSAKLYRRRDLIQGLTFALIANGQNQRYDTDQRLLHKIFWPSVKQDVMAHDSFYCRENFNYLSTHPFPTRRQNFSFVSENALRKWIDPNKCPKECRPTEHIDWEFC